MRVFPQAVAVMVHAEGGYSTNLRLTDLTEEGVLLALKHDGRDLSAEHGGPYRLVAPKLYFWKSAKWVRAFEFLDVNAPGFWEVNGYHLHADPWREERYSDQETNAMQRMRSEAPRVCTRLAASHIRTARPRHQVPGLGSRCPPAERLHAGAPGNQIMRSPFGPGGEPTRSASAAWRRSPGRSSALLSRDRREGDSR